MVGICGIVGDFDHDLSEVTDTIVWATDREQDTRYRNDNLDLYVSVHNSSEANAQPVSSKTGNQLCVWGDVIGFDGPDGYERRDSGWASDAEYCAELFDNHGLSFVDSLNSEFAGAVIDESDGSITVFTDRLGSRPIFYTEIIDGAFLFSTHPNTILAHPDIDTSINKNDLIQYLSLERVFGTHTPFDELYQLHPGSRLTYNFNSDSTAETVYWTPEYRPTNKSYVEFVNEFSTLYQNVVEERWSGDAETGILISGGSDSRLLLGTLGSDVTGFHMNERMNNESKLAQKVCDIKGADFRFLQREQTYQKNVLSKMVGSQIYTSFFDQAHAVGFEEEITQNVDEIFCGQYSDTLLSGHYLPKVQITLPILGWNVPINSPDVSDSLDRCLEKLLNDHRFARNVGVGTPMYLKTQPDLESILKERASLEDGLVNFHNVRYPSTESFLLSQCYYPLTNNQDFLFYYSLNQMIPTHYPYLDNRVIDFALSMPLELHLSKNIVNAALANRHPSLAKIPHSETKLPLNYPERLHTLSQLFTALRGKLGLSFSGSGSWTDHNQVLRDSNILEEHLLNDPNQKFCWDQIDIKKAHNIIQNHIDGESNYFDLYGILSLCNSYPFVEREDA